MNDHIPDPTKMISETPISDSTAHNVGDLGMLCRRLERELNAANDRIKRLEEDLMDAKNQYAALVADVVLYEDRAERIKRLDETLEAVTDKIDNAWGIYMKFKEAKP
jgi:predicted  nucleic acid-binding Zn-ribbon protein